MDQVLDARRNKVVAGLPPRRRHAREVVRTESEMLNDEEEEVLVVKHRAVGGCKRLRHRWRSLG